MPLGFCKDRHRVGRIARGGDTVGEHDHHLCIGSGGVKKGQRLGKGIGMIGGAPCGQRIHRRFEVCNGGDEPRVLHRRIREADDPNAAAADDLTVLGAVGGLVDDVDEHFGGLLQTGQTLRHAAGAVQDQHDVRGIRGDVWGGGVAWCHGEGAAAGDGGHIQFFCGACDSHSIPSFPDPVCWGRTFYDGRKNFGTVGFCLLLQKTRMLFVVFDCGYFSDVI